MNTVKGIRDVENEAKPLEYIMSPRTKEIYDKAKVEAEGVEGSSKTEVQLLSQDGNPIPLEKIEEMKAYAIQLRKKHPHMTQTRLMKKVADYFKVKLV